MCNSHSIKVFCLSCSSVNLTSIKFIPLTWSTCYSQFWKSTRWHQVSLTNFPTCGKIQPSRMLKLSFFFPLWKAVNLVVKILSCTVFERGNSTWVRDLKQRAKIKQSNFKHVARLIHSYGKKKKKKMQGGLPSVALKPTPVVNLEKENTKLRLLSRATFLPSHCFRLFLDTEDRFF